MQLERGKPPETLNAPYRAARIKDERWRSAGPGFEPGRAGPRLPKMLISSMKVIESSGLHEGMLMNVVLMSDALGTVQAASLGCYFLGDRMILFSSDILEDYVTYQLLNK
jgi:hypothetical protein